MLAWLRQLESEFRMNPKVELLTAAKRYLWDGITPPTTSTYGNICGALNHVLDVFYVSAEPYRTARTELCIQIAQHIHPNHYFSSWVREKEDDPHMSRHVVQAKRLEYVEQLIKEYSNESAPSAEAD